MPLCPPAPGVVAVGLEPALPSGEHSQLSSHLSDSLMLPGTLGFVRAGLIAHYPQTPWDLDAVEQGECQAPHAAVCSLLGLRVTPALAQRQTRRRNFHLRRELRRL